jgi:hypothetical protein
VTGTLIEIAKRVGEKVGWELEFAVAPNPEYVGLTAGPERIFVISPAKLSDLAAYEIEFELDLLERGDRAIRLDEEGDPRIT